MRAFNIWKRCSSRKLNSSTTYSFHLKCATPWRVLFMYIILCYVWSWSKRINKKHKWCRKLFFRHIFFCRIYFFTKTFLFAIYDSWHFQHKLLKFHIVFCLFISQMPYSSLLTKSCVSFLLIALHYFIWTLLVTDISFLLPNYYISLPL